MKAKSFARLGLITGATLVALSAATGLFLSSGKTLGDRHKPFSAASEFDFANGTFEDYIAHAKSAIKAERDDNPSDTVINNLAPFELKPGVDCPQDPQGRYEKGIVLTHGLLDSTYNMRFIGDYFQSQCFYVLGVLLPGHGTRPGDLLETSWQDWTAAEHFAASQLAQHANTLFLSGHSIGGALSVHEAAQNQDIDALILFAPAIAITGSARAASFLALLGKVFPKAAWVGAEPDEAVYRYESMSFESVAETWKLTRGTQAISAQTRQLPVFTVASIEDSTILVPAILDYMASNSNPLSRTLLYSQKELTEDDLDKVPNVTVVNSNKRDEGVLSLSHLGIMTPPSHPWFGRDGRYRNCSHYGKPGDEPFMQCKNGERAFYGETTRENLGEGNLERIAFNPFYDAMLEQIAQFTDAIK